jgi:hypothetical protein
MAAFESKVFAQKVHQMGARLHAALVRLAVDSDFDGIKISHVYFLVA